MATNCASNSLHRTSTGQSTGTHLGYHCALYSLEVCGTRAYHIGRPALRRHPALTSPMWGGSPNPSTPQEFKLRGSVVPPGRAGPPRAPSHALRSSALIGHSWRLHPLLSTAPGPPQAGWRNPPGKHTLQARRPGHSLPVIYVPEIAGVGRVLSRALVQSGAAPAPRIFLWGPLLRRSPGRSVGVQHHRTRRKPRAQRLRCYEHAQASPPFLRPAAADRPIEPRDCNRVPRVPWTPLCDLRWPARLQKRVLVQSLEKYARQYRYSD
ncbi:hypothetical protein NDU88_004073 [Pleurodeles waltl]|uniref:Uncharacterized protein n=1 Tax=Pleurodeles waltl TaxID=8319 RepID=A0AAV7PEP2_PLEWA|nr:hypothetical protein NDU88_004073 [Pleurodeles waltl]